MHPCVETFFFDNILREREVKEGEGMTGDRASAGFGPGEDVLVQEKGLEPVLSTFTGAGGSSWSCAGYDDVVHDSFPCESPISEGQLTKESNSTQNGKNILPKRIQRAQRKA
jgi:hypothetical protein